MVRKERLELSRREALEPKSSVSTNSTTSAYGLQWGGRWGLNPRPPESQSGALPTELRPPLYCNFQSTLLFATAWLFCRIAWRARQDSNLRPTA